MKRKREEKPLEKVRKVETNSGNGSFEREVVLPDTTNQSQEVSQPQPQYSFNPIQNETTPNTETEEIVLDKYQKACIKLATKGNNFAIIGPAGCGKSVLVKMISEKLESLGKSVAKTSTTGISAIGINGCTINRFGGYGYETDLKKMLLKCKTRSTNWLKDVLIIDEISMMDAGILDNLCEIAKSIRDSNKLFGGMQIILIGDFFQLPPCKKKENGKYEKGEYAYNSSTFRKLDFFVNLAKVYRQKHSVFVKLLGNVRIGKCSGVEAAKLNACVDKNYFTNVTRALETGEIIPTFLTPSKNDSKNINQKFLDKLKGNTYNLKSIDYCEKIENLFDSQELLNETQAEKDICIKENSQILLVYNLSNEYPNGSRGTCTKIRLLSIF